MKCLDLFDKNIAIQVLIKTLIQKMEITQLFALYIHVNDAKLFQPDPCTYNTLI